MRKLTVDISPLARDLLLDILGNIVLKLELREDPMKVAREIRDFIAKMEDK